MRFLTATWDALGEEGSTQKKVGGRASHLRFIHEVQGQAVNFMREIIGQKRKSASALPPPSWGG